LIDKGSIVTAAH